MGMNQVRIFYRIPINDHHPDNSDRCQQTELLACGSCLKDNLRLVFLEFGGTFSGGGSVPAKSSSPAVEVIVGLPWRLSGTVRKFLCGVIKPVELDRTERICIGPSPEDEDESLPASSDIADPPKPCMRSGYK